MSENPSDSLLFRPLPRMQQLRTQKPTPAQLRPIDGVWIGLVTLLSFVHYALGNGIAALLNLRTISAALCASLLYLLGWRVRDRTTGLIAGLLLATDLPFPIMAHGDTASAALTVITTGAFFAAAARSWPIALSLAAVASLIRPDGVVLGGLLLSLYVAQPHSKKPLLGMLLFFSITAVGWIVLNATGHYHTGVPGIGGHSSLLTWTLGSSTLFLAWFLLPFCAELAEAPRRSRWLPVVLWLILFFACESLLHFGNSANTWLPAIPIFFLLVAGGLARLLPILAGEMQKPSVRYVIATVAVLFCIGIRTRLDWHLYRTAWVNMANKSNPPPLTDEALFTETPARQSPVSPPISTPQTATPPTERPSVTTSATDTKPLTPMSATAVKPVSAPQLAAVKPLTNLPPTGLNPLAIKTSAVPPVSQPHAVSPAGIRPSPTATTKLVTSTGAKPGPRPASGLGKDAPAGKTAGLVHSASLVNGHPGKPAVPSKPKAKTPANHPPKAAPKPGAKPVARPIVKGGPLAKPQVALHSLVKPGIKPSVAAKKPPNISTFIMRHGRAVRRTKWAILWEQNHPKAR